eukprot:9212888-Alexandrium_andersonii.AAC.1
MERMPGNPLTTHGISVSSKVTNNVTCSACGFAGELPVEYQSTPTPMHSEASERMWCLLRRNLPKIARRK